MRPFGWFRLFFHTRRRSNKVLLLGLDLLRLLRRRLRLLLLRRRVQQHWPDILAAPQDLEADPRLVAGSARRLHDTLVAFGVVGIGDAVVEGEGGGVVEELLECFSQTGDGVGGGSGDGGGGGVEGGFGVKDQTRLRHVH